MPYLGTVELKESDIRRIDITSSTSATHTLTWTAPNEQSLIVTINGVKQQNNYTVSGTTLTLDTALSASDLLEVIGINDIGTTITPAQGSVDTDQLANDAVTSAKIAAGTIATADIADDAVDADKLANSINTEIAANTAKVTNATHTGDVTGATALTIANDAVDIAMLSATGTASSSTFLRGDNAWAAAGGGFNSVQAFTASGTWTRPADITKVLMFVTGGGGGGGRNNTGNNHPGSGSAGGTGIKFLDVSSISTSTITIGAAGTAASSGGGVGGNGGATSWADGTNTVTGNGGTGGSSHVTANAPGTASGGDLNITGGTGGGDKNTSNTGKQTVGGASFWGGGSGAHGGAIGAYGSGGHGGGGSNPYGPKVGHAGVIFILEFK